MNSRRLILLQVHLYVGGVWRINKASFTLPPSNKSENDENSTLIENNAQNNKQLWFTFDF
jgi:hypothetical protein